MNNTYFKEDFLSHKDNSTLNKLIDNLFSKCKGIAKRYSQTDEQAEQINEKCFLSAIRELIKDETKEEFDDMMFLNQFKVCVVKEILHQRKGQLIADTTTISIGKKESNLFSTSEYYLNTSPEDIILHLRKLNNIQQVIYNMICIDNFSMAEVSQIIQHNELSVKALLEKAKYNLFTSIKSIV